MSKFWGNVLLCVLGAVAVLLGQLALVGMDTDQHAVWSSLHFFMVMGNTGIAFQADNPLRRRLTLHSFSIILGYLLFGLGSAIGAAIDMSYPPMDAEGLSERAVLLAVVLAFIGLAVFWGRYAREALD